MIKRDNYDELVQRITELRATKRNYEDTIFELIAALNMMKVFINEKGLTDEFNEFAQKAEVIVE